MGKQSSRIHFQGKEHKDIYFDGHYHNLMLKGNELVWQKKFDEKYTPYIWSQYIYNAQKYNYYLGILYPELKVRNYNGSGSNLRIKSNDDFVFMSFNSILISKDGKIWKNNITSARPILTGGAWIYDYWPVRDGVIYNCSDGYFYAKINTNGNFISDEPIEIPFNLSGNYLPAGFIGEPYNEQGYVIASWNLETNEVRDIAFYPRDAGYSIIQTEPIYGNGSYYILVLKCISMQSTSQKRWILDVFYSPDFCTWKKRSMGFLYTDSSFNISYIHAVFDGEKFVLYVSARYRKLKIYITHDFSTFTEVSVPDALLVPFIGNKKYDYVCLMLNESASVPKIDGTYYTMSVNIRTAATMTFKGGKRIGNQSLVFINTGGIMERLADSIHVDNLYFQESENNVAIAENLNAADAFGYIGDLERK